MFKRVTAYPLVLVAILGNILKIHSLSIDQESAKSRKVGDMLSLYRILFSLSCLQAWACMTLIAFFFQTRTEHLFYFCAQQIILIQILLTSRSYIYIIYICMYINMFLFTVHLESLNAHFMFPLFRENQNSIPFLFQWQKNNNNKKNTLFKNVTSSF